MINSSSLLWNCAGFCDCLIRHHLLIHSRPQTALSSAAVSNAGSGREPNILIVLAYMSSTIAGILIYSEPLEDRTYLLIMLLTPAHTCNEEVILPNVYMYIP